NFDKRVKKVNQTIRAGDWVYVDAHKDDLNKLDYQVEGPFEVLRTDGHTYTILVDGLPDTVSSDHVTWAPMPTDGDETSPVGNDKDEPQIVTPESDDGAGQEFVWDHFVTHAVDDSGNLWFK
ncbi:hypothetical protein MMPV_000001, partial [Pyropia vietnamensis]